MFCSKNQHCVKHYQESRCETSLLLSRDTLYPYHQSINNWWEQFVPHKFHSPQSQYIQNYRNRWSLIFKTTSIPWHPQFLPTSTPLRRASIPASYSHATASTLFPTLVCFISGGLGPSEIMTALDCNGENYQWIDWTQIMVRENPSLSGIILV